MDQTKENLRRLDALRLYGGDTRIRDEYGNIVARASGSPFYQDKGAYRTLNALLFPGIVSEYSRIFREGHMLNPVYLENLEDTIQLYCDIFYLMCETKDYRDNTNIIAKRVERFSAKEEYEQKRTPSFVSASKAGYSETFSLSKDEVMLLEIQVPANVPYLELEVVLGEDYKYRDEKEVLLPPFVEVSLQEQKLEQEDRRGIRDKNGKLPRGKYRIYAKAFPDFGTFDSVAAKDKMLSEVCSQKETVQKDLEAMSRGKWEKDFSEYIEWKARLQLYLKRIFSDMWYRGRTE